MRTTRIVLFCVPAFVFGILAIACLKAMWGEEDTIEFLKGLTGDEN